eukprot:m51a1_g14302 hypothetical protein (997) ;mRNA; f:444326-448156
MSPPHLPRAARVAFVPLLVVAALAFYEPPSAPNRRYAPDGSAEHNYTSFYRAVLADGTEYAPTSGEEPLCPLLGQPPAKLPVDIMNGMCRGFYGSTSCCPSYPALWSLLSSFFANAIDDPCCARNLERLACYMACSKDSAHTVHRSSRASGNNVTELLCYVTNRTALAIYRSCSATCSATVLPGASDVDAFLGAVDIGGLVDEMPSAFRAVRGFHPQTGAAVDMDVLEPCGAMHRGSADCAKCYVPAHNTSTRLVRSRNASRVSQHKGYCRPSSSEMSECCAHDSGFAWPSEQMFPSAALSSECLSSLFANVIDDPCCARNLERLACYMACSRDSAHTVLRSGNGTELLCYVTNRTAQAIYRSCSATCSATVLPGASDVDAFLGAVDIGGLVDEMPAAFRAVRGFHPLTGAAVDMDVLEPCGAMHRGSADCARCYVPAHNTSTRLVRVRNASRVSQHKGYCRPSSSEMSECCAHDSGFAWPSEKLFPSAALSSECCTCLCPATAAYVDDLGSAVNATCWVAAEEAQLLYSSCNGTTVVSGGKSVALQSVWPDAASLVEALSGHSSSFALDFDIGAHPDSKVSTAGIVVSRGEDSGLVVYSSIGTRAAGSSSESKEPVNNSRQLAMALGIALGIPAVSFGVAAAVFAVWYRRSGHDADDEAEMEDQKCAIHVDSGSFPITSQTVLSQEPAIPPPSGTDPGTHSGTPVPRLHLDELCRDTTPSRELSPAPQVPSSSASSLSLRSLNAVGDAVEKREQPANGKLESGQKETSKKDIRLLQPGDSGFKTKPMAKELPKIVADPKSAEQPKDAKASKDSKGITKAEKDSKGIITKAEKEPEKHTEKEEPKPHIEPADAKNSKEEHEDKGTAVVDISDTQEESTTAEEHKAQDHQSNAKNELQEPPEPSEDHSGSSSEESESDDESESESDSGHTEADTSKDSSSAASPHADTSAKSTQVPATNSHQAAKDDQDGTAADRRHSLKAAGDLDLDADEQQLPST